MSALGHKQTFGSFIAMSAIPPKADIRQRDLDVRFVPTADIRCFIRSPSGHPFLGWSARMSRNSFGP